MKKSSSVKRFFSQNLWLSRTKRLGPGVLEIEKGRIHNIHEGAPTGDLARQKISDLDDLLVLPSAIDLHLHGRDFEESHKETLESLEAQAAKGGVAAGACMANTFPRLDSADRLQDFFKKAQKLRVLFRPFAAVTENLEGKKATDWSALLKLPVAGLSDDGKPLLDEELMKKALLATKKAQKILSLHEEDTCSSKASLLHLSSPATRLGVEGSPAMSEWSMVERDLRLAETLKAPVHFGHLSSQRSVALLQKARQRGVKFSAEITPHHALCCVEEEVEGLPLPQLSRFKVCPVIREAEDRASLQQATRSGLIDCFASDHAPHSSFEKDRPLNDAAHGMISLEYYFSLYFQLCLQAKLPWDRFVSATSQRPAELLRLVDRGDLIAGKRADFVIFDPRKKQNLNFIRSVSRNAFFEGRSFQGLVMEHWIQGEKVYSHGD